MMPGKNIRRGYGYTLLLAALLLLLELYAGEVWATEPGCNSTAEEWISQLASKKADILQNHTRAKCEYSGKWMRENQQLKDGNSWKQMCTDLVLIWTYQECVYFRDYIETDAYAPCIDWTRQMHEECMANNLAWFETTIAR